MLSFWNFFQMGEGYGIYVDIYSPSFIKFNNGTNTIFGFGNGFGTTGETGGVGYGKGYGIYAATYSGNDLPTINFYNASPSQITIDAVSNASGDITTTEQYGIYANNYALLKDKNNNDITANTIGNYVTFAVGKSSELNSAAVQWDDHFTLDWPIQ